MKAFLTFLIIGACNLITAQSLPSFFSDNMILQQMDTVPIWGKDVPGQTVVLNPSWGERITVKALQDSSWIAKVPTVGAGQAHTLSIKGSNEIKFVNILLGEVYFASGQSNMDMPLRGFTNTPVENSQETILNSRNTAIRFFKTERKASLDALDNVKGRWEQSSPATSPNFSAVAYHFAVQLNKQLGVPIGIITSSWGGSKIQAWLSEPSVQKFKDINIPGELSEEVSIKRQSPTALYNGMVNPYKNYKIKGILWYQGESDRSTENYQDLFTELIYSWREKWDNPELPFYFVQIAPYDYGKYSNVAGGSAAKIREAQLETHHRVRNTGMVVTSDVGDCEDVHPSNKQTIGRRLSYYALAEIYNLPIAYKSPVFKKLEKGNNPGELILHFDNAEMGFIRKKDIKGFQVSGEKGGFFPAKVTINSDKTITLKSENVKHPKRVIYGFEDCPEINLKTTLGFPVSPFRTELQ